MYKIALVGHKGLIGSSIYKYFYKKFDFIIFDRKRFNETEFFEFIKKKKINFLINALRFKDKRKHEKIAMKLSEIANFKSATYIFLSTNYVYFNNSYKLNSEGTKHSAYNDWGIVNSNIEKYIMKNSNNFIILRVAFVFGDYLNFHKNDFLNKILLKAYKQNFFSSTVQFVSFSSINLILDTLSFLLKKRSFNEIYNVVNGSMKIKNFIKLMIKYNKDPIFFLKIRNQIIDKNLPKCSCLSNFKLKKLINIKKIEGSIKDYYLVRNKKINLELIK